MLCAALAGLIGLAAAAFCLRRNRAAAAWRAGLLDECAALLDAPRSGRDRAGFATLSGRVAGVPVEAGLLPEALVHKRLPQLWLSATLRRPLATGATLDVLRRPTGAEFYAPADLPARFAPPPDWPADTLVRGSHDAGALLARAAPALAALLADPRVKAVLLTPKGLRLLFQASEGARGAYLILRAQRFPLERVPAQDLRGLLEAGLGLARDLTEETSHARAA